MSAPAALKVPMTPEEYLAFERASEEKHEYEGGEIFAMAGCTSHHDTIAGNVYAELRAALQAHRGPCRPFTSDMKVWTPSTGGFKYPDASIACGPEFRDGTQDVLLNPCVLVEVLSDSTEAYDRGKKFLAYRSIPTLRDYVLVSQHEPVVEHYVREPDGRWLLQEPRRLGEVLALSAVLIKVPIESLYTWVFPV